MLQAIRDKAQGWIAWAIVILISVPFALWGIQEYLGVGGEPVVAEVNGSEVLERDLERRARDFRENLRTTLGSAYRPDLISEEELREQVLQRLIDERVLLDAARDWNMRAGDDMVRAFIASVPVFQQDGRFSQGAYESVLRNQGMSPPMFESSVRQDIVLNQFRQTVRGSAFVARQRLAEAARLEGQRRDVRYALVPASQYLDDAQPPESDLAAFYQQRTDAYRVPEKVSLQYLLLDVDELADQVAVTDEAVRSYYEQHAVEFRAPEQRQVRHILVALPAGADEQAEADVLAEAQTLRQRLEAGESFAALAAEASDDPGSAELGGDLGWIEPGVMVAPFEEQAFELEPGVVSEPVRTQFGYHLIEVTDVRGGSDQGFDDVRDEVEERYRRYEAENQFYDYAERLADLSFENPGSLAPAAEALGLQVRQTEPFSEARPPELLSTPKAVAAPFSEEVLERGNNSELIELGPDRAIVLRVLEHFPEHVRPLEEVREEVLAAYRQARASARAAEAGEALADALRGGRSLEEAAAESGWPVEAVEGLRRDDQRIAGALVAETFSLTEDAPVGEVAVEGDYAVLELLGVEDGSLEQFSENDRALLANRLRNSVQAGEFDAVMAALREEADIKLLWKPGQAE